MKPAAQDNQSEEVQQASAQPGAGGHTRVCVLAWLLLVGLLAATWGLSFLDLQGFNTAAAMGIAVAKAVLVLLVFMELRHRERLSWVVLSTALVVLLVLFLLAASDYGVRVPMNQTAAMPAG